MTQSTDDNVEFRLGFVTDPSSEARLNALAGAVETAQKRMSASVEEFGSETEQAIKTVVQQANEAGQRATRPAGPSREADKRKVAEKSLLDVIEERAKKENDAAASRIKSEQKVGDAIDKRSEADKKAGEAAERAVEEGQRGRRQLLDGTERASEAIGKLARGAVFLGIAQEGVNDKTLKSLATVQAGIEGAAGAAKAYIAAKEIYEGFRLVLVANATAQQSAAAAAGLSTAATVANTRALDAEAAAAGRSTAALGARNTQLAGGAAAAGANAAASGAGAAASGAGSLGGGALAAGAIKMVGVAAVPAAIALGGAAVAAAAFRNATDGMTEAQRRAQKAAEDTGTFKDIFLSVGAAISSSIRFALAPSIQAGAEARDSTTEFGASLLLGGERLLNWSGALDTFGDAATAEAERRSVIFREQQAHLDRLRAIEIEGAKERQEIGRRFQQMLDDRDLAQANSPQERIDLLQGRAAQGSRRVDQARSAVDGTRDSQGNVRFEGHADEIAAAKAAVDELNSALEAQQSTQEALEQAVKDRGELERQDARDRRKAQAEELRGILDVIDAREKEIQVARSAIQTAEERFATLGRLDQQKLIDAIETARTGQLEDLSNKQVDLLDRLGTEEAQKFVQQIRTSQAEEAGFGRADLARNERQAEEEARRARDAASQQFTDQTGMARGDFDTPEERRQLKVNIEDLTTINVQMEESTEKQLDVIDERIRAAIEERDRRLQEESQARQSAREAEERDQSQKREDALRNAD